MKEKPERNLREDTLPLLVLRYNYQPPPDLIEKKIKKKVLLCVSVGFDRGGEWEQDDVKCGVGICCCNVFIVPYLNKPTKC